MKIQLELEVRPEELYAFFLKMVKDDIRTSTGKSAKEQEIRNGFKYEKKMHIKKNTLENVTAEITKFDEENYVASFTSSKGVNMTSFHYVGLGSDRTKVVYEEIMKPKGVLNTIGYRYGNLLHGDEFKKNVKEYFQNIELYIHDKREQK